MLLSALNVFFFIFHAALILFNVFGWAWAKTRKWNLITLFLTAFSWGVMGIWKGAGYCILTDWHWQIRQAMGIHETSDSYIVLLVKTLTGWDPPIQLANKVAFVTFTSSLTLSLILNARDWNRKRHKRRSANIFGGIKHIARVIERPKQCD